MFKNFFRFLKSFLRDIAMALIVAIILFAAISYSLLGSVENGVKFIKAFYLIRHYSVRIPDYDRLVDGALAGAVKSLDDPYSYYMNEEEFTKMQSAVEGTHVGVGIVLTQNEGKARILQIIQGGTAEEAGISESECIIAVDGEETKDLTLQQIVDRITGPEGTSVELELQRPDETKYRVNLERRKFIIPTVNQEMLTEDIAYVRISHFTEETPEDFGQVLNELRYNGMRKLVLDLRSNPGGSLQAVAKVAERILPKGELVSMVPRNGKRETIQLKGTTDLLPMAVLIDKNSASASEILAAATKDKGAGILIGETTHGKGTVQTIVPISSVEGIRITVAEYYSPNGKSIDGIGVAPDIEIKGEKLYSQYILDVAINELEK